MAMDLSMAFDTVDHNVLLNILQDHLRITGTALNWFDSYLRPYSCAATVQKARSSDEDLSFSAPWVLHQPGSIPCIHIVFPTGN